MKIKFEKELYPADSNGQIQKSVLKSFTKNKNKRLVFESKFDGSRYLLHIINNGNHLTSRRKSVKTGEYCDKIDNVPHFKKIACGEKYHGTVIDGEMVSKSVKLSGLGGVGGILNSGVEKAVAKQKKFGKVKMMAFNILRYRGKDVTKKAFIYRRKLLKKTLIGLYKLNPNLHKVLLLTPQTRPKLWNDMKQQYVQSLRNGFEGVMIKDIYAPDGKGMWKWKVRRDTCVIVTGFVPGEKKYKGLLGSLKVSVYHKNKLVEIGDCSGMTDKLRKKWSKMGKRFFGTVIEVKAQELGAKGRLRHPSYLKIRDDYPPEKCTLAKTRQDLLKI